MAKSKAERKAVEKDKRRKALAKLTVSDHAPSSTTSFTNGSQGKVESKRRSSTALPLRLTQLQALDETPVPASSSSSTGPLGGSANDVKVHRCRFVDYVPGSITALALTPSTWVPQDMNPQSEEARRGVLAVGRGNGDIEIWKWSGRSAWIFHRRLPGHVSLMSPDGRKPSPKIEHLVWVHQSNLSSESEELLDEGTEQEEEQCRLLAKPPRLIGSCGGEEVLEWDWEGGAAGRIKRTLTLPAATTIWSMAYDAITMSLALGCDDGTIRLVSLWDDGLSLTRSLDPCRTRLLSVAWSNTAPNQSLDKGKGKALEADPLTGVVSQWMVAGCADSSIRKWDVATGRIVGRMTTEKLRGEQTLVWSVCVIGNTIVSGDSLGDVTFWDPQMLTSLQTIRAHRADILCLCPSSDNRTLFSSGIDQKTCQMTLTGGADHSRSKWIVAGSRRLHSHDVRALALSQPSSKLSSSATVKTDCAILLSGGLDMSLILVPAAAPGIKLADSSTNVMVNPVSDSKSVMFADATHRKIVYVPQRNQRIQIARGGRLLSLQRDQGLTLWRAPAQSGLASGANAFPSSKPSSSDDWPKALDMELKCTTNLLSSAISPNGRFLVAADLYSTKLFLLNPSSPGLSPRRVRSLDSAMTTLNENRGDGASHLIFTPDSSKLICALAGSSKLVILNITHHGNPDDIEIEELKVFSQHRIIDRRLKGRRIKNTKTGDGIVNGHSMANGREKGDSVEDDEEGIDSESDESDDDDTSQGLAKTSVSEVAISSDGQWLASADFARRVHVFSLDALQHHCTLPSPEHSIRSLAFLPQSPSILVVGLSNNTLQIFDVEERQIASWARQLSSHPPKGLTNLRDPIIGMSFDHTPSASTTTTFTPRGSSYNGSPVSWERDERRDEWILIWGSSWICKFGLLKPPTSFQPKSSSTTSKSLLLKRKRSHDQVTKLSSLTSPAVKKISLGNEESNVGEVVGVVVDSSTTLMGESNSTTCSISSSTTMIQPLKVSHKYQPLLLVDFLGPHEMIVVERPFHMLLESLPPAWQRTGQFGT